MFPLLLLLGVGLFVASRGTSPPAAAAAPGGSPGAGGAGDASGQRSESVSLGSTATSTSEGAFGTETAAPVVVAKATDSVLDVGVKRVVIPAVDWPGVKSMPEPWRAQALGLLALVEYKSLKPAIDEGGLVSAGGIVCPSGKCPTASDARTVYDAVSANYPTIASKIGTERAELAVYELATVTRTLARREGLMSYPLPLPWSTVSGAGVLGS